MDRKLDYDSRPSSDANCKMSFDQVQEEGG